MAPTMRFRTALFDVDGTLIDSNGAHARSWTEALAATGVKDREDDVRRLIGMGGDKLLDAVAGIDHQSALGKSVTSKKKAIFSNLLPSLRPTNGSRTLLESLIERGVDLVVATSADDREVAALLKQAGVDDLLSLRASKDSASRSKPDPDIVEAALKRSGAPASDVVMIGDTPYDIEAATRAGVRAIALRCGGAWSDSDLAGAILVEDDPATLLAHLAAETSP